MRRDHKVPGGWKEAGEDVEAVSDGWKTAEEGDPNIERGNGLRRGSKRK